MFPIPDSYQQFDLVAIDPGLNNIGVAVFQFQTNPLKILTINAFTIKEERVEDRTCLDGEYIAEQVVKRTRMVNAVLTVLKKVSPEALVSESPFFDRRKPGSFAVLTEVINDIFSGTLRFNNNIRISMVAPLLVKHTLGVAGQKGKEVVKEAMSQTQEVLEVLESGFDELDEHAIDAIGVGYTYFKRRLLNEGKPK